MSLRGVIGGWDPVLVKLLIHYTINIGKALSNWKNNKRSGNKKEKMTLLPNSSTLANTYCIQKTECETEGRWQKEGKTTSEISKCFPKTETRWKFKFRGNILVHQILFIQKVSILQDKCLRHKCWPSVTAAVSEAARWKRCRGKLPCLPLECRIAMSWPRSYKQQCHIRVVRNARCSGLGKGLFLCPHCLFQNCFNTTLLTASRVKHFLISISAHRQIAFFPPWE